MKQMQITEEQKVDFDLDDPGVPQLVRMLKPLIYRENDKYFCLLGPDPKTGVLSSGDTPLEAIKNWPASLEAHIRDCGLDKEIAVYVRTILNNNHEENTE